MALLRLTWGGTSRAGSSLTDPVYEIWSASLSLVAPAAPVLTPAITDDLAAMVSAFHTRNTSHICVTEVLEYAKLNEVNLLTGLQVTDPTNEHVFAPPVQGAASARNPVTTSCRISIDDGTRDKKSRGGFYMPRVGLDIGDDGRFPAVGWADIATSAKTFLQGINNYAGLDLQVGVWSRRDKSVRVATRQRVGNVPDNISRRKSAMQEAYNTQALTT